MKSQFKNKSQRDYWGIAFLLPSLLILTLCYLLPMFMDLYYSFTSYNIIQEPKFIGLENYRELFSDKILGISLRNTLVYTIIVVPLQTVLALVFAVLLARVCSFRWGNLVKSILFIPVITSMILVGTIWRIFLTTDGGYVNNILQFFNIAPVNWLGGINSSLFSICLITVWKLTGYFLVIYYAAIMDIPKSYYEAAKVDGSNQIQQFWHITLPLLKPITYLVVTLGTIWSFQVFDLVYTMTGGGPGFSTTTLVLSIYNTAFKQFRMGYASSISIFFILIILVISVVQKYGFREKS